MNSNSLNNTPSFYQSFLKTEEKSNIEQLSSIANMEGIFPFSFQNEHFICKCCFEVPRIQIIKINTINYECKNKKHIISIDDLLKELESIPEFEEDKKDYLLCREHKKKYRYYCNKCNCNICRECLRKTENHLGHASFVILDELYYDFNIKIKNIAEILKINKDNSIDNSKDNDISDVLLFDNINKDAEQFIRLISILFNDFQKYPNYVLFQNIVNIENYLTNFIKNKNNKTELKKLDYKRQEKIYGLKALNERLVIGDVHQIVLIEISYALKYIDLKEICKAELFSLESLIMTYCFIKDISPLKEAKFKNIKLIDFALNEIDDKNVQTLNELHFDNLRELNLYINKITDFNFFNFNKNNSSYEFLEKLFIGGNHFNKNVDNNDAYSFFSLKTIGLSKGTFNKDTINKLTNFKFYNLEYLYLSDNEIHNISFFKDLNLPRIKKITLNDNYIEDFEILKKYKTTINIIEIKNNNICNINYLENFVEECKVLSKIFLNGNKIDLNDVSNQLIIEKSRNFGIEFEL